LRIVPFFLVISILVLGGLGAYQTLEGPATATPTQAERPTVTPRPRPTSPRVPTPTVTPTPEPTAVPTQAPSPTPEPTATARATPSRAPGGEPTATPAGVGAVDLQEAPAGTMFRVGNTGGAGVFLRRTPRMGDRLRAWRDGTPMLVVGPPVEGEGRRWGHVMAPDGAIGYIPAEYLVGGQ
jgi:hypothetical protein